MTVDIISFEEGYFLMMYGKHHNFGQSYDVVMPSTVFVPLILLQH